MCALCQTKGGTVELCKSATEKQSGKKEKTEKETNANREHELELLCCRLICIEPHHLRSVKRRQTKCSTTACWQGNQPPETDNWRDSWLLWKLAGGDYYSQANGRPRLLFLLLIIPLFLQSMPERFALAHFQWLVLREWLYQGPLMVLAKLLPPSLANEANLYQALPFDPTKTIIEPTKT